MPLNNLQWDQSDVMACLEVPPSIDYDDDSFAYEVSQDGLLLKVMVCTNDSYVGLTIQQRDQPLPLVSLGLYVRDAVHYTRDARGDFLELKDCVSAESGFKGHQNEDLFTPASTIPGFNVHVRIKPAIQIRTVKS